MTGLEILAIIRLWLPVATAAGLITKVYFTTKRGITNWANKILDNHMAHIQEATERASTAVVELSSYHRDMLSAQRSMVDSMITMTNDFHAHVAEDTKVQQTLLTEIRDHRNADRSHYDALKDAQAEILTGIAVIKTKVE